MPVNEVKNDIPVIKTFIHDDKYFMYDTFSNRLFGITKEQFLEIRNLQKNGLAEYINSEKGTKPYEDIMMLINKGVMKSPFIEKIEHPETENIEYMINRNINYLILQVTRDCNFKCRYCLFSSDNKIGRRHEKINMSWNTAKESVDFLYDHSKDSQDISLGFYGGEPLLNFDLIFEVLKYTESKFKTKKIKCYMTTNASLLNDKIVDFLVYHDFNLTISLDGPENIQNKHRKFHANGNDTFKTVFENINRLRKRYEHYFNKIRFLPVIFNDENSNDVMLFFRENGVSEGKVSIQYPNIRGIDYLYTVENIQQNQENLYNSENYKEKKKKYTDKARIANTWHHSGPCIPAVFRLFVNVHGNFYPCEKNTEHDALSIGSLNYGIDLLKVIQILNIGNLSETECKKCWAIRFCSICIAPCLDIESGKVDIKTKLLACETQKKSVESFFKNYIDENIITGRS